MPREQLDQLPIVRDGSHFDANGDLTPNTWYQTGEHEYIYHTDANGHIDRFIADDVQLKTHDGRLPHDGNTPGKLPGDHAGHLIADGLGGSPFRDNLVSMLSTHNLSSFRKLEIAWERALLSDPPGRVSVEARIINDPTGRPQRFEIRSVINGRRVDLDLNQ
ncbi:DNA/RNA non-specific endonuclease [Microbacterium trichothecenolyticum]|uniref:Type VII secretion system protein EssD-like domain-containing protein n=1 Tax=Microbacterium trichothecenolyticum TaxID=69370 RepID=A0ABU0TTX4_MICTR|nr:DNA/RNA non-specific endonuclease [Microbacterium trichothecenolyticum]MDQ1123113.1 hypothetical protein [Microbacterium trichothecenolyticum]